MSFLLKVGIKLTNEDLAILNSEIVAILRLCSTEYLTQCRDYYIFGPDFLFSHNRSGPLIVPPIGILQQIMALGQMLCTPMRL